MAPKKAKRARCSEQRGDGLSSSSNDSDLDINVVAALSSPTTKLRQAAYGNDKKSSSTIAQISSKQGMYITSVNAKGHAKLQFGDTYISHVTQYLPKLDPENRAEILNWLCPSSFQDSNLANHERISNEANLNHQAEDAGEESISSPYRILLAYLAGFFGWIGLGPF